MTWFYTQLVGLVCGCGSMLEQSWWLRSIDIISGSNSIQAASNNKYADKDKYKWAVNMYECLNVDLFNLHPPMALSANSLSQIYATFHDRVEQFHDATWVGVNSDWISQLLYEWQKFMSSTCPFLFSDPWRSTSFSNLGKSQIIFQWSTSTLHLLECASIIVRSTFETIANDHKTFPHT